MKIRTEARRDLILETAAGVFLEFGFDGASMAEITKRVGGSKATVYGYFPSKEQLFLAVVHAEAQRHLDPVIADLAAKPGADVKEDLMRFGTALVEFMSTDVGVAGWRMVMAQSGRSEIGRLYYQEGPAKGIALLAAALEPAMERGELRRSDPVIAAQHLEGLLTSEIKPRLFEPSPAPLPAGAAQDMARRAVEVFFRGYGA